MYIDVIDYGGGNIGSLVRCLTRLSANFRVVGQAADLSGRPLILPGVGAFAAVMEGLRKRGFVAAIETATRAGRPFLGICVGLQVLFEASEESPGSRGIGLLSGEVVKYRTGKVPQVGWNRVRARDGSGWPDGYVYFVNSYHACPADAAHLFYTADYHGEFCAGIRHESLTAFQFHPEKSGAFGHGLVRRWLDAL